MEIYEIYGNIKTVGNINGKINNNDNDNNDNDNNIKKEKWYNNLVFVLLLMLLFALYIKYILSK